MKRSEGRHGDALGYRAKIGVLAPATNTIAQPEYEAMRPRGVTNHVARMPASERGSAVGDMDVYRRSLARGTEHIKAAIDMVKPCAPDAIVLGHSIDTFRGGVAGADAMEAELTAHAGATPVVLPSHAFVAALRALGIGPRLAALTPYFPPGDEQVIDFFESAGFEIVRLIGLKCPGPLAIAATPEADVVAALKELARENIDAIVQPGTNLATAALAADAERWLGVPLLACNTVVYWRALRGLGIDDRVPGFGPLFERC
jgi:maleate isomerase